MKVSTTHPIRTLLVGGILAWLGTAAIAADCTVNAAVTKQRIDGFGAGVAFLYTPPQVAVKQDPLPETQMDQLFGTTGAQFGLTLIRMRISPDGDHTDNILDGQRARARGVRILATPWTPPAAMKDNGSLIHGSLLPAKYGDYVGYLNSYLSQMAANGAAVDVISLQNEPDWNPDYEGCTWTAEQFRTFCRDFAGGINAPVMMPESLNFNQALSDLTLNDPSAVANIDYVGGHLYGATIKDYPLARSKGLPMWMTEYLENDQTIESSVTTARQINDCLTVGNMSAYIWWKCIGDANGLLNNAAVPQNRGYVMAQFSRFVRPGDYRVDVPTNTGPLSITAFKDTASGRFALVAVNTTTGPVTQNFNLQGITLSSVTPYITSGTQSLAAQTPVTVTNSAFTYVIPATAVVTFSVDSTVAPVFTTQPAGRTVSPGTSVTFAVAASGTPAPTYQWRKNGVDIGGATSNTYTILSVVSGDAGTYTAVASNSAATVTSNTAILTVTAPPFTRNDFDGDGKADIFLSNTVTGDRAVWFMNGTTIATNAFAGTVPPDWIISATGDFNGDGKADLFWTNTATGDRAMWLMNGSVNSGGGYLGAVPVAWVVSGAGDFDGDGKADVLWTNTATGERAMWLMNGSVLSSGASLGVVPVAWVVSGTGDFNGDGKADVLLSNAATGDRVIWFMNGGTISTNAFAGTVPVAWVVSSTGDFNSDGKADIFWTNTTTGDRAVWLMNGNTNSAGGYLGAIPVEWTVSSTGDYSGDGKADIFWSNTVTGDRSLWLMNGITTNAGASLGAVPVAWVSSY